MGYIYLLVFFAHILRYFVQMLAGLEEKKKTVKLGLQVSAATSMNGGNYVGSELRNTPSGPDPLHHNGGSPKMPRNSP